MQSFLIIVGGLASTKIIIFNIILRSQDYSCIQMTISH
jgi:hypothetical protein